VLAPLLLAPPTLHVATTVFFGGAVLLSVLSLLDHGGTPLGWRPSWQRAGEDETNDDGGCTGSSPSLGESETLSGRWIGIQLFGPGAHDYFAWALSLTQCGTSLDGEVHLRMASAAGLVSAAGRVLVRGTVVGDTVTMTLITPQARRGPSAPFRLTVGAGRRAMVGTAHHSRQTPGYLISLVRR
jgi:hypothetical protein